MNSSKSPLKLAYAESLKAAQEGFDWESPYEAASKVKEELGEILEELKKADTAKRQEALKDEIGDLFLACVCLSRHCKVDPDEAILFGLEKFLKRFATFKTYAKNKGIILQETSAAELMAVWKRVKDETSGGS